MSLISAQLLLQDRGHPRQEAHPDLRPPEDRNRRRVDLRLQVPHRRRQDSLHLRGQKVQEVHELDL